MIKVEIILKNMKSIIFEDKDEFTDEIKTKLSGMLKSSKVTILQTDEQFFIIRPNSVESIIVTKIDNENVNLEQNKKAEMDIITDVD